MARRILILLAVSAVSFPLCLFFALVLGWPPFPRGVALDDAAADHRDRDRQGSGWRPALTGRERGGYTVR
jgi:hypothetical protein